MWLCIVTVSVLTLNDAQFQIVTILDVNDGQFCAAMVLAEVMFIDRQFLGVMVPLQMLTGLFYTITVPVFWI